MYTVEEITTSKHKKRENCVKMLKKSISSLAMPTIKLPKRFEGTIVEKWANYWKGLARDYKGLWNNSFNSFHFIENSPILKF